MGEVLFIGAGTNGAKKIRNNFQPYIKIREKTCIEHVFDAACGSQIIKKVYIWGDKTRLEKLLNNRIETLSKTDVEIKILNERKTPFDSFFFAYLDYIADHSLKQTIRSWENFDDVDWNILLDYSRSKGISDKQVYIILSDTPLITSREIDFMISHADKGLDIVFGRTLQKAFEKVLDKTNDKFLLQRAVKNFYNYVIKKKEVGLIVNSFFAGKPLRIDRRFWGILIKFYENRTIIERKKFNFKKIKNNYNLLKEFLFSQPFEVTSRRSHIMRSNWFLLKTYRSIVRNSKSDKRYRDLSILFSKIEYVTGLKIGYQINECIGSAFDIDTQYEADFVEKNFDILSENIKEIGCY